MDIQGGKRNRPGYSPRETVALKEHLSSRLKAYVLLATAAREMPVPIVAAAGIALATSSLARADIVTTQVNETLSVQNPSIETQVSTFLRLDINHDGINDFQFVSRGQTVNDGVSANMTLDGLAGAGVMNNGAALVKGTPIGPKAGFKSGANLAFGVEFFYVESHDVSVIGGPWAGL